MTTFYISIVKNILLQNSIPLSFFFFFVTCRLKIPNKTICTNKNVCKTGARAALSGVEPERSPDRAPGSTHHYTASTSLVLFENVFINVITSIILNTINMFSFLYHFLAFIQRKIKLSFPANRYVVIT